MQAHSITFIEHIEVADEFITSENPDLTRVFIIKPSFEPRLKKQIGVEETAVGAQVTHGKSLLP